jgi:deoxycytidylate deaminase
MIPNLDGREIRDKFGIVYRVAARSDDISTRNGALLVDGGWNVISGCNHMMEGYGHKIEHHQRPFKYWVTEHAERDVILKAAAKGISTKGLTMVANWVACPDCARAIVKAGIVCVVTHKACMDRTPARWKDMVEAGLNIMEKGGVQLHIWDGKVGDVPNLNGGEVWYP